MSRIITKSIRPIFTRGFRTMEQAANDAEATQRKTLAQLIHDARDTEIGREYNFSTINSYADFAHRVTPVEYSDVRERILRMVAGEKDVLWRGKCTHFAQSSGTSDGRSKYIPVTLDSLNRNHYRGGFCSVAAYLNHNPSSGMFDGRSFILGGSFANSLEDVPAGVTVGDLSANLISNINPLVNLFRVPSKRIALMSDWEEKLPALVQASVNCNITNISGVPSWFLTVLKEVINHRGAQSIHDVWPNLEVFFHGGISFAPYRSQYESICDMSKMHFVETYNASEGFFAVQAHPEDSSMLLIPNIGIFYEFIPISGSSRTPVPIWEVQPNRTYELIISSCNGLWRYHIGDTVTIMQTNPVKIRIAGRTKHYINAFGEELMVHNAESAIAATTASTGIHVLNYTAAPVFTTGTEKGHHQWLIEFAGADISDEKMEQFATVLDDNLRRVNSDYDAKRSHDIFLDRLAISKARHRLFDDWLKARTGRIGGQRKVPRLSNDRTIIEQMLAMNSHK